MNEEKVTRETTETWRWTDWENGYVDMTPPCEMYSLRLRHESEIREHWPEKVKARIRVEILSHRPEGEDEFRNDGELWQFRIADGNPERRVFGLFGESGWGPFNYDLDSDNPDYPELYAAARAWRDKHAPKPLASNQVLAEDETSPIELRWHEGSPEGRYDGENSPWFTWKLGGVWCKAADAWFRANCPADRFVMDDGRVHCFEMRDDGEAECREVCAITIDGGPSAGCKSQALLALYRFRDAERAKWGVRYINAQYCHRVEVKCDGSYAGCVDGRGTHICWSSGWPTWVRTRAEKMWRERETQWETRWYPQNPDGESVEVFRNGSFVGRLTRTGRPSEMRPGSEWPPHILAEARAKFRENYQLKPNEIWLRGEVSRLKWNAERRRVIDSSGGVWWPEAPRDCWGLSPGTHADEAERLAAYDKCRAFWYENVEDAVLLDGVVLNFEMRGDVGYASGEGGYEDWLRSTVPFLPGNSKVLKAREKLRTWTDKQLAARKVLTITECTVTNDHQPVYGWGGQLVGFEQGPSPSIELVCDDGTTVKVTGPSAKLASYSRRIRITIEPAGES